MSTKYIAYYINLFICLFIQFNTIPIRDTKSDLQLNPTVTYLFALKVCKYVCMFVVSNFKVSIKLINAA